MTWVLVAPDASRRRPRDCPVTVSLTDLLTAPADRSPPALRDIRAVCARHDVPPLAAAIQFPFGHPAVTSVLIGARSPREVDESVALLRYPVPDALWSDLKESGLIPADAPALAGGDAGQCRWT